MAEIETIEKHLQLGASQASLREAKDGTEYALVPSGFRLQELDNRDQMPGRIDRRPIFHDIESFINYVTDFKDSEHSRIFVNPRNNTTQCILDYSSKDNPRFHDHIASLEMPISREWKIWIQACEATSHRGFSQEEFAEFLEEHGAVITEPTAASLMELVTNMKVTRTVNYSRAINLQDGQQQFSYTDQKDGAGTIEFPAKLELGIPVFDGGERYKMDIMLRYRLQSDNGTLRFGMVAHRKDDIMRDAFNGAIEKIRNDAALPTHIGTMGPY